MEDEYKVYDEGNVDEPQAEELIESSDTSNIDLSASEVLDLSKNNYKIKKPTILSKIKSKFLTREKIQTPIKTKTASDKSHIKKFKYFRTKDGKIYKRIINPAFKKLTNKNYDKAGREIKSFQKFRGNIRKFVSEDEIKSMDLQNEKIRLRNRMGLTSAVSGNIANRILEERAVRYQEEELRRLRRVVPSDFARRINSMHDLNNQRKRDFKLRRDVNLLKAHLNLDKTQRLNPLDVSAENNILKAENLFSESNPRRININKTGRANILQTKESGNNLKF